MAKKSIGEFDISYELKNLDKKNSILFLHGWGSSKEVMKSAFENSFKDFCHIYVDLPGFNKSSLPKEPLHTQDYAKIIKEFLKSIDIYPDVVVGHSFGGKVATLLEPPLLVLLSSAGIVWKKPLKVRLKIALFKALKPFGKFRNFFVADDAKGLDEVMYETFKNVVDEDFSLVFKSFKNRALLFWGKDDRATPLKSGKKIDSLIKDSTLFVLDGGHYFFLNEAKRIEEEVLKEYEKLQI